MVLAFIGAAAQDATQAKRVKTIGTVTSVSGDKISLTSDSGSAIGVIVQPTTRLLRMEPGQTDLKSATPIQLTDVQIGDRLLVAGTPSDDGKTVTATSAVVMKKSAIAAKQEREREDWQKRGMGGVVKSIDPATGDIVLSTGGINPGSTVMVQVSKNTVIRRYSPDSVQFDDAKPGTIAQIKPGDQLRARGDKSSDGKQLAAEEIVSGTFRNVAGTAVSTDEGKGTLTVTDLATKQPVTIKVAADSQMHKLPPLVAARIAARLKGGAASGAADTSAPAAAGASGGMSREGAPHGGFGAGQRTGGAPDFQQMLARMPEANLSELHKGDAVMIVATEGSAETLPKVIILLSGVEPILTAAPSQASTILSPWNLSTGGNLGTGDAP